MDRLEKKEMMRHGILIVSFGEMKMNHNEFRMVNVFDAEKDMDEIMRYLIATFEKEGAELSCITCTDPRPLDEVLEMAEVISQDYVESGAQPMEGGDADLAGICYPCC